MQNLPGSQRASHSSQSGLNIAQARGTEERVKFLDDSALCACRTYSYTVAHQEGADRPLLDSYRQAPMNLKQAHWMRITFGKVAPDIVAAALTEKLPNLLFDCVALAEATLVLIYKAKFENLRQPLATLIDREPISVETALFSVAAGKVQAKKEQKHLVEEFQLQSGVHVSNMVVVNRPEDMEANSAWVLEELKELSHEEYTEFVTNARIKNSETRSKLEEILCNGQVETRIKELRKLSGRTQSNVIYGQTARELGQVQSPDVFKSSWQHLKVTIHDTTLLSPLIPRCGEAGNQVTLRTFLDFPELHHSVSLFLPGAARKGKTELAKYICYELALAYQGVDCKFILANTLDCLRHCQSCMAPGVPVLLDDIGSGKSDDPQLIHSSTSIWKAILQASSASQNRGRQDDIMWAAKQSKVLTTNCSNLAEWMTKMFGNDPEDKEHQTAVIQRLAEVEPITNSLYVAASVPAESKAIMPRKMSAEEIKAHMKQRFS